ncbi:DNA-binding transcriptional regulator [Proteiniphilum saccharofermentans]|uniref:DNA-binding transcriptional regulator n=1 Tax=Proteiniphilum saccharofermentans TaxID=1642647 RepID=A0A1R3SY90_9BACT|nr:TetR/AcrR family transcriptional regulator [Proteiniphilum saccharofermentans]SCD21156.1 DNA-binding transcriptional regulator [Proteiniphilum saccharofermentans]
MDIKERIIEKASRLFQQYGIKNVSMDEIASSLGISKRTIYENFKDKEDILLSALLRFKQERDKHFIALLGQSPNVVDVFIKIIEEHQHMPICNVRFFEDIQKYYPRAAKLIREHVETNNNYLRDFLRQGIKEGYIREDLDVNVAAFLVEETTYTYIRASYLEKPPFSFQDLFYTMMINFVRGILTGKGIRIIDAYLEQQRTGK